MFNCLHNCFVIVYCLQFTTDFCFVVITEVLAMSGGINVKLKQAQQKKWKPAVELMGVEQKFFIYSLLVRNT